MSPERREALRAPFLRLLPEAEKRGRSTHLDRSTVLGMAVFFLLFWDTLLFGRWLASDTGNSIPRWIRQAAVLIAFSGSAFTVWRIATGDRRLFRRDVLPPLTAELKSLSPSQEEFDRTVSQLQEENLPGIRRLPKDLWRRKFSEKGSD